jgi:hypothetical protein
VDKVLTTHHDLLEAFARGVEKVLGKAGIKPSQVDDVVVHATTRCGDPQLPNRTPG